MVVVDDISVRMAYAAMMMGVTVGLGAFPAFMVVIVMTIVGVLVLVEVLRVTVHQERFIPAGPQYGGDNRKPQYTHTQNQCGRLHAEADSELSGEEIEDQPTGMGQGELSGKIGRPIRRRRRPVYHPSGRCLDQGPAYPDDEPHG